MRQAVYTAGTLIVFASVATSLHAGNFPAVPEIDSSSFTAGLGLLTGAVMIVRSRMRRK
ncbi:hypothetical protein BH18ACI5_BH18ACI5_14980 [soil metagenome]